MTRTEILKIAKPITPKAWQVQAIINGATSMREIIKPQPIGKVNTNGADYGVIYDELDNAISGKNKVGDIFYVREQYEEIEEYLPESYETESYFLPTARNYHHTGKHIRYIPSTRMPKEAARLFIRNTGVRVERLQDKWEWVYDFEKVEVE